VISNAIVIDTNLVFSALISKASQIREILFESNLDFYSPNILITEIYKHNEKLLKSSKLTSTEFFMYFNGIIERIQFVPTDFISLESRQKAYDLCYDVDIKDLPFVALSIDLKIPLWTGDKKLKIGLIKKGFHNFYNQ
jgi:predicted nucleic acid-binding protein